MNFEESRWVLCAVRLGDWFNIAHEIGTLGRCTVVEGQPEPAKAIEDVKFVYCSMFNGRGYRLIVAP